VATSDQLDDLEIEDLYDKAQRSLHYGRLDEAKDCAQRILQGAPDSTSAHELWGDVLLASGDKQGAAEEFQRAMELEPANADAERKYGMVLVQLQQAVEQRQTLESGDLSRFRGAANKDPSVAAGRSALFPGMGQLYNGEYEKGVVLAVLALLLLIPAVDGVCKAAQWLMGRAPISLISALLAGLGVIAYMLVWAYGIYDAYHSGRRIAAEQDQIGAQVPPKEVEE